MTMTELERQLLEAVKNDDFEKFKKLAENGVENKKLAENDVEK